ncbi:DUF4265 domain-containing protein [Mucilaginibacter arboris]|uniref:DUF4265 domain-containing protein n=1 Tax=Mucilaginibacter arboris TaxID=2682090 RepID=A0A7K1T1N8_9SPHI|nr:DUF4265 domain-containing protein [Mucilaginibacter arboris]MVN23503.1 DUF4265 domain-containing protein [Mucilaginibacter arboris]
MTTADERFVKILFRFYSDVLDEWIVETLWAEIVDANKGLYKIDSIPFFASITSDDIVFAEYDDTEKMLTYKETIEYSGNSLIQVVILDETFTTNEIRDIFNSLDCKSEKFKEGYFVIEVLADKNYEPIKQKLSELKDKEIIAYAEPVLSEQHQY